MTGFVAAGETQRDLGRYYHWDVPGSPVRIYLHSGMADRLQAEVLAGLASGPQGGRETGGILLGHVEAAGDHTDTFLEDFIPVPCSQAAGPRYVLSGQDTAAFEAALLKAAFAACDSSGAPPVLGYYRAHNRDALSLAAADLAVIEDYFTEPAGVFMLVKAVRGASACTAGFFFWEDGCVQSEFSPLEAPLGRMPALAPVPEIETLPAPSDAEPALPAPSPRARSPWPGLLLRFAVIVLATLALVVSVVRYLGAPRPSRDAVSASAPISGLLGLQVEPRATGLLVTWNQSAPEILNATRAVLSIRDGSLENRLHLDPYLLSSGSVLYTPAGADIPLRREVDRAGAPPAVQSLRVLQPITRP